VAEVGRYGCHFDGLDELDTIRREGGGEGGREGGKKGRTFSLRRRQHSKRNFLVPLSREACTSFTRALRSRRAASQEGREGGGEEEEEEEEGREEEVEEEEGGGGAGSWWRTAGVHQMTAWRRS